MGESTTGADEQDMAVDERGGGARDVAAAGSDRTEDSDIHPIHKPAD